MQHVVWLLFRPAGNDAVHRQRVNDEDDDDGDDDDERLGMVI